MHATSRVTVSFILLGALAVAGCRTAPEPAPTESPGVAGPMSEKERMEAERWARATEGIDFEAPGGRVVVEPIFPHDDATAARHLAEADELVAGNRVMDAMEHYGLAARHDPDLADAYVGLGITLKRKARLDEAAAALRTAIDLDDRHLEARYQLAMTLWTPTRHDEAIEEMNALLAIDDDFAIAHERLAIWHYYLGNYDDAWRHVQRARELGHELPAQFLPLLRSMAVDPEREAR